MVELYLFAPTFRFESLDRYQEEIGFSCPNREKCGVDPATGPIYTPFIGDDGSSVMAVAEAPSASNGVGTFCGGRFADVEQTLSQAMQTSPLNRVLSFVRSKYGVHPHFTDVVKCGLSKQNDRKRLSKRFEPCRERFLLREIEILKPKIILCFGKCATWNVNRLIDRHPLASQAKVRYLLHYSRNNNPYHKNCEECLFEIWDRQSEGEAVDLKDCAARRCPHKG